jgi:hypothetical protein
MPKFDILKQTQDKKILPHLRLLPHFIFLLSKEAFLKLTGSWEGLQNLLKKGCFKIARVSEQALALNYRQIW